MRTVAIVNQKGGCGKTTTSINLAACLARLGNKTLLVDMDPQGHCGVGLAVPEEQIEKTIYDTLLEPSDGKPADISQIVWQIATDFDLAPSNIRLAAFEQVFSHRAGRDERLRQALSKANNNYQWCVIDCPPSVGLLTFNALQAADEVVVPVETGFFSLHGLAKMMETLEVMRQRCGRDVMIRILPTLYDTRTKLAREVLSDLRKKFKQYLMESTVNFNTKLKEAASFGQPITEYDPGSRGYKDFVNLARELMGHQVAQVQPVAMDQLSRPMELVQRARQLSQLTTAQFGRSGAAIVGGGATGATFGFPAVSPAQPAVQPAAQAPVAPARPAIFAPAVASAPKESSANPVAKAHQGFAHFARFEQHIANIPESAPASSFGVPERKGVTPPPAQAAMPTRNTSPQIFSPTPIFPTTSSFTAASSKPAISAAPVVSAAATPAQTPPAPVISIVPPAAKALYSTSSSSPAVAPASSMRLTAGNWPLATDLILPNRHLQSISVARLPAPMSIAAAEPKSTRQKIEEFYGVKQMGSDVLFAAHFDNAKSVLLAGDFNNWTPLNTPMVNGDRPGDWRKLLPLAPGRYKYRLVVDGRWVTDPNNKYVEANQFGELDNVIEVARAVSAVAA